MAFIFAVKGCGGGDDKKIQVATIAVSAPSAIIDVGETLQFTATAKDSAGNTLSGATFTWASSNTDVATINSTGLVTAKAAGAVNITASSGGITSSAVALMVTDPGGSEEPVVSSLGTASFTLDDGKKQSVNAAGSSSRSSITVTDASGITWKLDIPGNDAYNGVPISMTPMKNTSSDSDIFNVSCGVMFGPDGFIFIEPATLTVTLPSNSDGAFTLYEMKSDGTQMAFANVKKTGSRTYEVTVNHFSGVGGGSSSDLDARCALVLTNYNSLIAKTKDHLKTAVNDPPAPLDLSNLCKDQPKDADSKDTRERVVSGYINSLFYPEKSYINNLLNTARQLELCGTDHESADTYLCQLNSRIMQKAVKILDTYSTNEKKYKEISRAVLVVARSNQLIGCSDTTLENTILEKLKGYALYCRNYWYDKLVKGHDLEGFNVAMDFQRSYELLGGADGFAEKLKKAWTFKVTVHLEALAKDNTLAIQASSETKLQHKDITGTTGPAQITYQTCEWQTYCGAHQETLCMCTIGNSGFETNFDLVYDACDPEKVNKINLQTPLTMDAVENWSWCAKDEGCTKTSRPLGGTQSYTHLCIGGPLYMYDGVILFDAYLNKFDFEMDAAKAAKVADKNYERDTPGLFSKIHIIIEHTPE